MPGPRPYDPLIGYDFSSWMDRLTGTVKRSWGNVLKLILLGSVLPTAGLILVLAGVIVGTILLAAPSSDAADGLVLAIIVPIGVAIAVGIAYLSSVTGLSVMKTIANDAAGRPVPLMAVYKSSLSLGWPTLGWHLLAGLAIGVGLIFCLLPGVYLYVALSMLLPIMAFERRNGFAGSFRLVHTNFWPTAGRILLLYLFAMVISYAVNFVGNLVIAPVMVMMGEEPPAAAFVLLGVVMLLVILLSVAATLVSQVITLCGCAVTYAELRGRLQPSLTAAQLAAEANAP